MADDDVRVPAGWYPDPLGLPQLRWWDNHAWTEHTSDARQPMMAQDTIVTARLAYKDDDDENDELLTRRQRREQEQPATAELGGAAFVDESLPNADALLSLEAPAKAELELDQPSPAARLLSSGLPDNAPTSTPYDLDERFDDLQGEMAPGTSTTGNDAPYRYGYGESLGYRSEQYAEPKSAQSAQSAQQSGMPSDAYRPDSYSFWADPYAQPQQQNPYAYQEQAVAHHAPAAPASGSVKYDSPPISYDFSQPGPAFAPGSPDAAPELQPVSYPSRRGTMAPVSLPVSTGPVWVIALMPLIMLVLALMFLLSGGAGKLSPMFAGVVLLGPYFLAIILAIADRAALQRLGYEHTANWAWAFLTAPAYLIVRLASVVRETGRGFGPLLTWIAMALLAVASVIAVPGTVIALTPGSFSAEAEASVQSDAAVYGSNLTVDCPDVPPLLIQDSMTCDAISDNKLFPITVSLQRTNGWIGWRVDNWGLYATNR